MIISLGMIIFALAWLFAETLNIPVLSYYVERADIGALFFFLYWLVLSGIVAILAVVYQFLVKINFALLAKIVLLLYVTSVSWSLLVFLSIFSRTAENFINIFLR